MAGAYRRVKSEMTNLTTVKAWRREYGGLMDQIDLTKPSIALQIQSLDKGGMEEVVAMLAKGLDGKGFNVLVFLVDGGGGFIEKRMRKEGVNIVLLHENERLLDFLVRKLRIGLCSLHYSTFGMNVYVKHGVRTVYTIHNNYIWDDVESIRRRKLAYRKITSFVAVSDQVRSAFARKYEVSLRKIVTIPNGSDVMSVRKVSVKRADFGLKRNDFVFLNIATFSKVKAHMLMIAAFYEVARVNDAVKMIFVGNASDTEYYEMLQAEICVRQLDKKIIILDFLPKGKIIGLYDIADCALFPSLSEGFSMASIEAASRGLPLIMTDIGGARHIVKEGVNGMIIRNPYKDILKVTPRLIHSRYMVADNFRNLNELVAAMNELVASRAAWKLRAKREVKNVVKNYTMSAMIDSYTSLFSEALREG